MKKQLFILLLLIPTAFAQLEIAGFLYDPPSSDSGNEWVELYNPTNKSLSLQNYSLWAGNGANQHDWTLRYNGSPTIVQPGHYFLLGEFFIENSDEEVALSLQNGPDAIRLDYLNETLEVIGWGTHEFLEYYQNSSLEDISSKAYVRVNKTGVNSLDFKSKDNHVPRNSFYNESLIGSSGESLTVIYDVENYAPDCSFVSFENEDISHKQGLQLYPFTDLLVTSFINISDKNGIHDVESIVIDNTENDFFVNSSQLSYLHDVSFFVNTTQPAGIYTHSLSVVDSKKETSTNCYVYYELLPIIGIRSDSVAYMKKKNDTHHNASIVLSNIGNVDLLVNITIEDISQFGLSVAFESLMIDNDSLPMQVHVPIQSTQTFELVGEPTFGLRSGSYAATLSFIAQDDSS